jgi:hypothetical protein
MVSHSHDCDLVVTGMWIKQKAIVFNPKAKIFIVNHLGIIFEVSRGSFVPYGT